MTEQIEWMNRMSIAVERAKGEGKHLIVDFTSPR